MSMIGNLAAFVGCVLMVAIGFIKKKEHILTVQCAQFAFLGIGNLALGAISGLISNVFSILRNLVFARVRGTMGLKLVFIAIQVALTLWTGVGEPIEWLPVIAAVIFTWSLDAKSDILFKVAIIAGQGLWMFYDWHYSNYVAFAFDILTMLSNLVGILLIWRTPAPALET